MHTRHGGTIRDAVDGARGFATGLCLSATELERVKALIAAQWFTRLSHQAPECVGEFRRLGLEGYHHAAHRVDHALMWPKRARILPADAVAEIRRMAFVGRLQAEFGRFEISDEDGVGWEEIYWRLVRPHAPADVGPLHADAWFWELGHGQSALGRTRVKVWVAVVTEPGLSGLRLVPGSHRREWRYHGEPRHGMMKPQLDEREDDLDIHLVATEPGDAVVFHDRLLHGGALNRGTLTRVSFEFTMLVA